MTRQAFENWMTDEGKWPAAIEMADGNYKLSTASQSWKVWQAATDAALERAAQVCDAAEIFAWEQWKGTGHPHTEGVSDGAASLARDIRALKDAE